MEMLMFHINKREGQPIYIQLYENIKQSIMNGRMHEGEKLPSKRQLSQYLSVSQTTVENAYAQLVDEGYIYSQPKSGFSSVTSKHCRSLKDITPNIAYISKPDD